MQVFPFLFLSFIFFPFLSVSSALAFWPFREADGLKDVRADFNAGRYASVVAALQGGRLEALRGRELEEGYVELGQSDEKLGRTVEALGVYQVGVRLYPKDVSLLRSLGLLLHQAQLESDAESLLSRALVLAPGDPATNLGLAEIDRSNGFLDESAGHYEQVLKGYPDQAPLWREDAGVLLELKRCDQARKAVRKALALSQDADGLYLSAKIERACGSPDAALDALDALARKDPGSQQVLLVKGLWLIEDGRFEAARVLSEEVLKASPDNPLAYFVRAEAEVKLGQVSDAVQDLETAEDLSQDFPFLNKAASALDQALKKGAQPSSGTETR